MRSDDVFKALLDREGVSYTEERLINYPASQDMSRTEIHYRGPVIVFRLQAGGASQGKVVGYLGFFTEVIFRHDTGELLEIGLYE